MQLSAKEARDRFSDVVNRAAFGKEQIIVTKNGKPVAAVVSIEDLETLKQAKVQAALGRVNQRYGDVLKRLAE